MGLSKAERRANKAERLNEHRQARAKRRTGSVLWVKQPTRTSVDHDRGRRRRGKVGSKRTAEHRSRALPMPKPRRTSRRVHSRPKRPMTPR